MRFTRIFFFAILLILVLVAITPSLLSTKLGNQLIATLFSSDEEQLKLTELNLSWLGPQKANNIFLKKKTMTLSLENVETNSSLFSLLWKKEIGNSSIGKLFYKQEGKEELFKEPREHQKTKFIGTIEVKEGEVIFEPEGKAEIKIENLSFFLDPSNKNFQLRAMFDNLKQKGSMVIHATYGEMPQFKAEIHALPTAIFSTFDQLAPLTLLGETLTATLNFETNLEESIFHLTASSDALSVKAEARGKENLVFTHESNLTLTLSPAKLQQLGEKWLKASTVLEPMTLRIHPHSLKVHLPLQTLLDLQLSAGFDFSTLSLLYKEQKYSLDHLHGEILWGAENSICFESDKSFPYPLQINGCLSEKKPLSLQIKTDNLPGILSKFHIPNAIDLGTSLTLNLETQGKEIIGKGKSDVVDFDFCTKKTKEGYEAKATGTLLITSHKNILGDQVRFRLEKVVKQEKDHLYIPSLELSFENASGKGVIQAAAGTKNKPISLETLEVKGNYQLSKPKEKLSGSILFDLSGKENSLFISLQLPDIHATVQAKNWLYQGKFDRKKATFHLEADATELSTSWLDSFFKNLYLSSLLGPTLNFHLFVLQDPSQEAPLEITFQIKSEGLQSQGTLKANHNFNVSEDAPIFITYELTPTRYRQLLQRFSNERFPTLILTKPTIVSVKISKLVCPKEGKKIKEFLCQTGFEGTIHIAPLTFVDPENRETVIFQETIGTISGESFSQLIHLDLQSTMITPEKEMPHASFSLAADLVDFFHSDGTLNPEGATLKISSHLTHFSTSALLGILPLKQKEREKFLVIFGNLMSYNLSGHISKHEGPISLSINSSQLQANCPFYLTRENLFLTSDLDAQITVTQEISEMYIKDINPLFVAGIYSQHPIALHISSEGFVLPLSLDLQGISIHQGILNIGQIFVANGNKVQELMGFLKASGISQEGQMSAWFTPIYFQLKQGTISYQRFDLLLATNVHLAFWGRINLITDQVQMTLGIASSTLQRSFNIHGVPSSQMFQIQVQGSTSDVQLDWGAATARITILVASSAVGQIGKFIGSILERIYSALGEKPTPPPTTYPFPWALGVTIQ